MAVDAKAKELKAAGVDVMSFAAGEPDFPTPQHVKDATIAALNDNFTGYTAASGITELKQAVCDKLKRDNNLDYSPSEVLISCGAKHTLHNIFEVLLEEGDEVLIPTPYWVSYSEQVKFAGGVPVLIDTDEKNKVTAQPIAEAVTNKTKLLLLNSPSNPTGMIIARKELEKIAHLAIEKDFLVVSDEVYEHFLYGNDEQVSIASFSDEIKKRTLTVNSVSKTYSMTGWRIGYCAGPQELIKAMGKLQSHTTSNPTSIAQKAAVVALTGPQDSVAEMKTAFEKRRDIMVEALNKMKGISCQIPEGAFYCFADISQTGKTSLDFCSQLLEEAHVAVVPGVAFGAEGFVRLSYACSDEQIVEGMKRMTEWCEKHI